MDCSEENRPGPAHSFMINLTDMYNQHKFILDTIIGITCFGFEVIISQYFDSDISDGILDA